MGSKRRYSRNDLVALKVMKALVDAGLSLKAASDTVAKIRETSEETLASSLLVHNGDSVKLITAKLVDLIDLWTLLNRSESVVHVLPLAHLIADIDAAPPGHKGGRNLKMTPELIDKAQRMYDSHNFTMPEIAQSCRVAPTTIYNYIKTCQPPQKGLT